MTRLRRIALWGSFFALLLLAVLCIAGAFMGADRARLFFNSFPLAVFWILLASLLVVSLAVFAERGLTLGAVAAHLGPLLILVGALLASDAARGFSTMMGREPPFSEGCMQIIEGQSQDAVFNPTMTQQVGQLPFQLRLTKFSIDRYPAEGTPWSIVATGSAGVHDGEQRAMALPWAVGADIDLPHWPVRLRVVQYLPHARAVYAPGAAPKIYVTMRSGGAFSLRAAAGAEIADRDSRTSLRVAQILAHSAKVEIGRAGGSTTAVELPLNASGHVRTSDVDLRCIMPEPEGAVSDPGSDLPAMQVLAAAGRRETARWLIPDPQTRTGRLALSELVSGIPNLPNICLVEPEGPVRAFRSDVDILREGRAVGHESVAVNHPLHYGGYYFYQYSYGSGSVRCTILRIKRDTGIVFVYAGFVVLFFGVAWWAWVQPVLRKERPVKNHDSQV